jgi:protein-L-isoaspartate O-methyltransferase
VSQVDPELYALRPWYHDFSALGFDTTFLGVPLTLGERVQRAWGVAGAVLGRAWRGRRTTPVPRERAHSVREVLRRLPSPHLLNQPVKERHLMALAERALAALGPRPACLELFSADGYYSCRLKALAPGARVTGVELDPAHVRRAETIARRLGLAEVSFRREDVWTFLEQAGGGYDLVLCAGGLYHVGDPARLLEAVRRVVRGYLVVQSVVTLETEDAGYLVRPAPGWQHGCRFTHAWLRTRLLALGWQVLEEARAELPGNRRPHDRGSSFFLCRYSCPLNPTPDYPLIVE